MLASANKLKSKKSKAMSLEKENLEAHVDLCAERYQRLEEKYQQLQDTIDKSNTVIHERISKMKDSMDEMKALSIEQHFKQNRIIITTAVAVIGTIVAAVIQQLIQN
jgi:predicted nuclease with TOPRIM domain